MKTLLALSLPLAVLGTLPSAPAANAPHPPITAVISHVSDDYVRTRLPDGSIRPETYAFGQGEFGRGEGPDASIDGIPFMEVAKTLAEPLARQHYVPTSAPEKTDLLIVVYWGRTVPSGNGHEAFAQQFMPGSGMNDGPFDVYMFQRDSTDQTNRRNALILGYQGLLDETDHIGSLVGGLRNYRLDLLDDITDERYYVVLLAFDFQKAWKEKQKRLLWLTRFNISTHGQRFDRDLPGMAAVAGQYFGTKSRMLVRTKHVGRVEIGEPTLLGYGPAK